MVGTHTSCSSLEKSVGPTSPPFYLVLDAGANLFQTQIMPETLSRPLFPSVSKTVLGSESSLISSVSWQQLLRTANSMVLLAASSPEWPAGGHLNKRTPPRDLKEDTMLGSGMSLWVEATQNTYRNSSAADATSHLFFAYLRSLSPEQSTGGISMLPRSLQKLVSETEYPPQKPDLLMTATNKVVMIVDTVSPTPYALLRRANHFQYREEDRALQEFSEYDDPVQALTDECRRVLKSISAANQSQVSSSKHSTSLRDASWSRFEDIGFASALEEEDEEDESALARRRRPTQGLRTTPASGNGLGRPVTPSWADFLSSGFLDDDQNRSNVLLPPDKVLPPIDTQTRQRSSQPHRPRLESDRNLEPGELASITVFDLDDSFWWVWMSSLAPEETSDRKSAFGRCAVIETAIRNGRWLVMEEMVAGAAPEPAEGAYIAEKKGFFSWTKRSKTLNRRKSTGKQALDRGDRNVQNYTASKTSIGPDTHARIQAKAAQLRAQEHQEKQLAAQSQYQRRGRTDAEVMAEKTKSVLTLQPTIIGEASSAMKWVNKYDKGTIKDVYLSDYKAGRGSNVSPIPSERTNGHTETNGTTAMIDTPPQVPAKEPSSAPVSAPLSPPLSPPVQRQSPPLVAPVAPPAPVESQRKPVPAPQKPAEPEPHYESEPEPEQIQKHESKVPEAGVHPLERPDVETPLSPVPPPKDDRPMEVSRDNMVSPDPSLSPESSKQAKKLHKDPKEARGFRKLFARKNRSSKLPDNAAANVNHMLQRNQPTPEPVAQQPTPAATPEPSSAPVMGAPPVPIAPPMRREESEMPTPSEFVTPMEEPMQQQTPPAPKFEQLSEPTYEPSIEEQYPTKAQNEPDVQQEFSRFDQGPLADQPAFIPDESDEDDATPPPISRHPNSPPQPQGQFQPPPRESSKPAVSPAVSAVSAVSPASSPPLPSEEKLSQSAGPGVQDRWAQIRKKAAERAATRQPEEPPKSGAYSRTTDGDDDTSGEESE